MQEKNRSPSQFSQRTEILAEKKGLLLRDLPQFLGFSERMLFGYRSGKYPISDKAWRKLEAAERAAGLIVLPESVLEMDRIETKRAAGGKVTAAEEEAVKRGGADLARLLDGLAELRRSNQRIEERLERIEAKLGVEPDPRQRGS